MSKADVEELQKRFGHVKEVSISSGSGNLPKVSINTQWSSAEVYLHGAHVTSFQMHGEAPLIFMSRESLFMDGKSIRGGVPVIFPWFGPKEGGNTHGFVRQHEWSLTKVEKLSSGRVQVRLKFTDCPEAREFPAFQAEFVVTAGPELILELIVKNISQQVFSFETCLHTYFQIGDVKTVRVRGLKGVQYIDKCDQFAQKTEQSEEIGIGQEVDRVYMDTTHPVEIVDPTLKRRILVEKSHSKSTVVWNPWIEKSKRLPDFGDDEYPHMICVESGNVEKNREVVQPGGTSLLEVKVSSSALV